MGGRVGAAVKLGGRAQKWREEQPVCQQQQPPVETVKRKVTTLRQDKSPFPYKQKPQCAMNACLPRKAGFGSTLYTQNITTRTSI